MFGTVACHCLGDMVKQFLPVCRFRQVNKINDDDTAKVAQAQLPGNFIGGGSVYVHSRLFMLGVPFFGAVAAVDVYHVHGFGLFNNQIGSAAIVDGAPEQRLDLFGDAEGVEDGKLSLVMLNNIFPSGSDEAHVVAHITIYVRIIYMNVLERGIEYIPQQSNRAPCLFVNDGGRFGFRQFGNAVVPAFHQGLQLLVKFGHTLSLRRGTHDDTDILRFDTLNKLAKPYPLFGQYDFG
ncbi:hypothetical protein Barb7_00679 [Bacteroidales bacterium Barb7]|nr:hypothetical protein Barb7_00679 [Bacteroidales bacterium Barb7]